MKYQALYIMISLIPYATLAQISTPSATKADTAYQVFYQKKENAYEIKVYKKNVECLIINNNFGRLDTIMYGKQAFLSIKHISDVELFSDKFLLIYSATAGKCYIARKKIDNKWVSILGNVLINSSHRDVERHVKILNVAQIGVEKPTKEIIYNLDYDNKSVEITEVVKKQ